MSYSEWKNCTLGNLVFFQRGHDLTTNTVIEGNYPVVGSSGIIAYHNSYTTKAPCITVGRSGNSVGKLHYCDSHCWAHNTTMYIKEFFNTDPLFIYYYLKTLDLRNYAGGSAVPTLNRNHIHPISVCVPSSIQEQKQIASILYKFDEKIEVNNQINKKLESMAQEIFKHWFVGFEFLNENGEPYKSSGGEMVESELGMIPKGWEIKSLEELLDTIEAGNRPKGGAGSLTEGVPSIGAENIIGLGEYDYSKEKFVTKEYFNNMNKGIVQSEDVLLYKDGAQIGRKTMFMDGFPHKKCCINSHVFILRSNKLITQSYLYFWLDQDWMTQNIINLNANSAQPGINQTQVKTLKILVPDKEIINKFDSIIKPLLKKIFSNCLENNCIKSLRNELLPKLMSGEIRVPHDTDSEHHENLI